LKHEDRKSTKGHEDRIRAWSESAGWGEGANLLLHTHKKARWVETQPTSLNCKQISGTRQREKCGLGNARHALYRGGANQPRVQCMGGGETGEPLAASPHRLHSNSVLPRLELPARQPVVPGTPTRIAGTATGGTRLTGASRWSSPGDPAASINRPQVLALSSDCL